MACRRPRVLRGAEKFFRCAAQGAAAAALFAPVFTACAADAPSPAASSDVAPMRTESVKPGLYRITGAGGGTLLRLGTNGAIVVDANRAGTYRPLTAEIQRIAKASDMPVRALVLTAVGPDQAGNLGAFVEAGVPVYVQQQALARLVGAANAGSAAAPKPFVTYDADRVVHVGDARAEVEHVGRGRTGVDSVVYFRDLRVVAVGELYTHGAPQPDCASGGTFAGWAAAITHLLWLDFDVAVPSRGAPVGKPELTAFRATLQELARRESSSPSGPSDCRPPE